MRLTTFTDFGLRTLMYLASQPVQTLSSVAEVAKVYNCSQNHLVKVVGKLKKLGYLQAIRGKNGGICLAKNPLDISVGMVIRQLENHLDGVDCNTTNCQLVNCCKLKKALQEAMESFLSTMDNYTLADLQGSQAELDQIWTIGSINSTKQ